AEAGTTVDVTSPNHTLHSTIRIKENFGKIKVAEFWFSNGAGGNANTIRFTYACGYNGCGSTVTQAGVSYKSSPGVLVGGTKFDGVYSNDIDISGLTIHGTYTFRGGDLIDAVGNREAFTQAETDILSAQSFTTIGAPVDPNADVTAPVIKSIQVTSQPETGSGQPITATIEVTDQGSGVSTGGITFMNMSYFNDRNTFQVNFSSAADCASLPPIEMGWGVNKLSVPWACLVSGDANDGVYQVNMTLPRFLQFGDYIAYQASVTDKASNNYFYNQYNSPVDPYGAFAGKWTRAAFDYTADEDYWSPTINSYSWSKPVVNTGKGPDTQFVDISFTDKSGLGLMWLSIAPVGLNNQGIMVLSYTDLLSPGSLSACTPNNTGLGTTNGVAFTGGCLLSGDLYDGVIRLGFTLPQASPSGRWDLTWINAIDSKSNGKQSWGPFSNPFTNTPTN
ncbi:MAG: hypothetical protein CGW95_14345, partial [Phenylobacterium zucineum]